MRWEQPGRNSGRRGVPSASEQELCADTPSGSRDHRAGHSISISAWGPELGNLYVRHIQRLPVSQESDRAAAAVLRYITKHRLVP